MTLNEYVDSIKNKRIGVIGIGVSNTPLIELLASSGCDVTAHDKNYRETLGEKAAKLEALGVKLVLGPDYLDGLDYDVIFRTPGLHPGTPQLAAAREKGCIMTSEMEAFFALCPCHIIAITGSDGKTTTSTVISELLKAEGKKVHLGGNIGKPLLTEIPGISPDDWVVLELSSFQLHSMKCCPDVAVITNISPNHLDVHPSYEDYIDAKRSIFRLQNSSCRLVLNLDNDITKGFADVAKSDVRFFSRRQPVTNGVFLKDGMIYASNECEVRSILPQTEIRIPGAHNVENYMAAFAATEGIVSDSSFRSVAHEFAGVRHRLEIIRKLNGVTYCNDSIASSPTRTIAGLRSFNKKVILIAGGYDKHIPFDQLGDEICRHVKALFLTGFTSGKIREAVSNSIEYSPNELPIYEIDDFREAVLAAHAYSREGDIVLLSPACASFDKFKNFAQRGDTFRDIILGLEEK